MNMYKKIPNKSAKKNATQAACEKAGKAAMQAARFRRKKEKEEMTWLPAGAEKHAEEEGWEGS